MAEVTEIISKDAINGIIQTDEALKKTIASLDSLLTKQKEVDTQLNKNKASFESNAEAKKKVSETNKQVDATEKELLKLNKQMEQAEIKLTASYKNAQKSVLEKKAAVQESTKVLKDEIILNDKNAGTLEKLGAKNRILQAEKRKLNLETKEGQKRLKEINIQQDKNNSLIQKSSNQLQKQKINIGNYGSAFNGLLQPIQTAGNALKAFLANPVVATIAAIVGAFKLLTSAMKRSEEGQNLLNKGMAFLRGGLNVILDLFTKLSVTIVKAFENPGQALKDFGNLILTNVINRFKSLGVFVEAIALVFEGKFKDAAKKAGEAMTQLTTGLDSKQQQNFANSIKNTVNEINNEADASAKLQKRRDELIKREREFIVEKEKIRTAIAQAREAAADENIPLEERLKINENAIALTEKLASTEIGFSKERAAIAAEEVALGESTTEQLTELERLRAEIFTKEQERANTRKRLLTEQRTLQNRYNKESVSGLLESLAQQEEAIATSTEIKNETFEQYIEKQDELLDADLEKTITIEEEKRLAAEETANRIIELEREKSMARLQSFEAIKAIFGRESALGKAATAAQKAEAIRQNLISLGVIGAKQAEGEAKSAAALPFPFNIPLILGTVAQFVSIISLFKQSNNRIKGFWKGTNNAPGSGFIAGERGRELMQLSSGETMMVDSPTFFKGSKYRGATIKSNPETERIMSSVNDMSIINFDTISLQKENKRGFRRLERAINNSNFRHNKAISQSYKERYLN